MAGSLEGNKLIAAVLTAGIIGVGSAVFAGILYHPHQLEEPVYRVEAAATEGGGEAAPAAEAQPIGVLLASASAEKGEKAAKKCAACHSFDKGGANKVGPNLWGVVNRPIGSHEGFSYSDGAGRQERRAVGLRSPEPVPHQPQGLRARHQDELRRHQQGRRARRRHRLPALARRRAGAAARRLTAGTGDGRRRLPRVRGAGAPAGRLRRRDPAPLLPHAGLGRDQGRREPGHDRRPRGRGGHARADRGGLSRTTASWARSMAATGSTPSSSGCSTRSTAPSRSSPAARCSAR